MRLGSDPRSLARRPCDSAELLGQILTPPSLALQMARRLLEQRPSHSIALLDPATGPATFPAALAQTGLLKESDELVLHDIDPNMIEQSSAWAKSAPCPSRIFSGDYLESEGAEPFDRVILNPPYVRQEWIDRKEHYRELFSSRYGVRVPGTANLYVYFLVKAVRELKPGGYLCCIVYDSWQSTRFGAWLWAFLEQECDSIERVAVPRQPFRGRLIDATILFVRRTRTAAPSKPLQISALGRPERSPPLADVSGLVPVETLFRTKRGLRLKQTDFFRTGLSNVRRHGATPFVKKSSGIKGYHVPDDHGEAALLVTPQRVDERVLHELKRRLAIAQADPAANVSVLTWFRERPESWAWHRDPPHAPFLFNYYLRNRPRHLHNPRRVYADNFYGLTPLSPTHPALLLALLNSTCFCVEILAQARNQGSGLAKVQLFEYRRARLPDWRGFSKASLRRLRRYGDDLMRATGPCDALLKPIDETLAVELGAPRLRPRAIRELYRDVEQRAKTPSERP